MRLLLMAYFALLALAPPATAAGSDISARAVTRLGYRPSITRVLRRARNGRPITIAAIGGSITEGFIATPRSEAWFPLTVADLQARFPRSAITAINAAVRGTGSDFGAQRLRADVLVHDPDVVIVEFSVNDWLRNATEADAIANMQSIVRQCREWPSRPAVIFLETVQPDGNNTEEWHTRVARRYSIPVVSMRAGLWPELEAGRLVATDLWADDCHPNNRGHAYLADFLDYYFDHVSPCCAGVRAIRVHPSRFAGR